MPSAHSSPLIFEHPILALFAPSRRHALKRPGDVAGDNAAERRAELFCCSIGDRRHVVRADVSEVVEQRNRAVGRRRLDANEAKRRRIARAQAASSAFSAAIHFGSSPS